MFERWLDRLFNRRAFYVIYPVGYREGPMKYLRAEYLATRYD